MTEEIMAGTAIIFKALKDQGVDVVFGYPGGAVLPLYEELFKQNHVRHILVRHEQAAVHAAEGYARSTGKVGCVIVTSGPGATNTVTGLLDALYDSTPLVVLCAQVPTSLIGNDAFQEADITGITRPCTKHNYLVKDINVLARTLHEAFLVARSGRPGPVLIDLPKDVQTAKGPYIGPAKIRHKTYQPKIQPDAASIKAATLLMAKAKRPVFYVGGGVGNSGEEACKTLTELVRLTGFPCTQTLMGLGAFPASDPLSLGMLGMHGTVEANLAMHGSDLIICVGARFDDRVTGRLDAFAPDSKKIHIDIDPSSINKTVAVDISVVGDAGAALAEILAKWKSDGLKADPKVLKSWWTKIESWRDMKCLSYAQGEDIIKPQYAIERLRALTRDKDIYVTTEVGQHQMWAAQFFSVDEPRRLITSAGLGTMGYGLPAAVGAQVAHPDSLVIDLSGDASFMMNLQEMATILQHNLPVKVFILNNSFMGMVRQWQELFYDKHYSQTDLTGAQPDFVKLAEAFGAIGLRVTDPKKLDETILEMIRIKGPVIVDCHVDPTENCFPMIPAGAAHNESILGPEENSERSDDDENGMVLV